VLHYVYGAMRLALENPGQTQSVCHGWC